MIRFNAWFYTALVGLLWILVQLFLPDFVPDYINALIVSSEESQSVGIVPILKATLIIYLYGGVVSFIVGVIGIIRCSFFSNQYRGRSR